MTSTLVLKKLVSWRWIGTALRIFFGAVLALWLMADVLQTVFYALSNFGPMALLTDGVLNFRTGAALVILPLAGYLLLYTRIADEQQSAYLRRARMAMLVGAGLCALALFTLNTRVDLIWTALSGVIALVGVLARKVLKEPLTHQRQVSGWINLVLLIFFYVITAMLALFTIGDTIAPYPAPYPLPALNRDERWQQDARYLASELPRLHKNAYHTISEKAFQDQVRQLEVDIPLLTDDQVAFRMIGLVAAVGDAHTSTSLPPTLKTHTYPVEMRWFADGLYVTDAAAPYQAALGARVLGIGRLSTVQLEQAVRPLVSHENEYWARKKSPDLLRAAEALHTIGAIDDPTAPTAFQLAADDGQEFNLEITPVLRDGKQEMLSAYQKTAFLNRHSAYQWMEYREKTRTLYFRYTACVDPAGFKELMGELFQVVDTKPVDRLIVDMRGNPGGATMAFDTWFVPEVIKRERINQPGTLFVLIDNGTYSAGSDAAVNMQVNTRATLAGEPTGGKPNGYGDMRFFTLPNSKMRVEYSVRYFQTVPGDPPSVFPDRLIPLTAANAFAGRDPVLETLIPGEIW